MIRERKRWRKEAEKPKLEEKARKEQDKKDEDMTQLHRIKKKVIVRIPYVVVKGLQRKTS